MVIGYGEWFFGGRSRHFGHNPCQRKKGRNGTKKYGRSKVKCERYRREGRRERNKARKVAKAARRGK